MTDEIPASFMRGGTSKGVFLREHDIPPAGAARDDLLLRVMGTPDALQVDGIGGSTSSTSKVMVVGAADPDGVVPYWFAQVGITEAVVDWRGNCGNLTFAVAPFALDAGLVTVHSDATVATVRLRNMNTGVRVDVELEVRDGLLARSGNTVMTGVPGTGATITTKYLSPAGAALGSLLPLGAAQVELEVHGLQLDLPAVTASIPIIGHGALASPESAPLSVTASLVDATNPYLFVARDEVPGADRPLSELRADEGFLETVERIRATAAVAAGAATSVESAVIEAPVTPRIVLVGPGHDGADIDAVTVSMQQVHRGIPMTGAMCLAAARAVPGTVVADLAGESPDGVTVVRQPLGLTRVTATTRAGGAAAPVTGRAAASTTGGAAASTTGGAAAPAAGGAVRVDRAPGGDSANGVGSASAMSHPEIESVGITGTARTLMRGVVVPRPA